LHRAPAVRALLRWVAVRLVALALAAAVWLPLVHLAFAPGRAELAATEASPRARALADRQLALWEGDVAARAAARDRMRATNPEWDFMGRTFLVLALANLAEREPDAAERYLAAVDRILADTLRVEAAGGHEAFLLGYARRRPWVAQPPRSLFVDGELALMLGARCLAAPDARWSAELRRRAEVIADRIEAGPVLCAESYPDECWIFCNTAALAALRLADVVLGTDHAALRARWVATARERLVDPETGLLISELTYAGRPRDGPEGSSIWAAAHFLQLVDADFARDQYDRARRELARTCLGFGWAREWPESWVGPIDVDSGLVVPVLEASPSSSGLALVAAAAFDDDDLLAALVASLDVGGFPVEDADGGLRYAAGNQVGDAVLLYALVEGPLWTRAREAAP